MSDEYNVYIWSGRTDTEKRPEEATRLHQIITQDNEGVPGICIIGFCSDEGVARNKGRVGARNAPNELRKAMANLPWSPALCVCDAGNVACEEGDLAGAHQQLSRKVSHALEQGHFPVVLGGGHEVAFGSWLGLIGALKNTQTVPKVGIINLDAHFDLRLDSDGASSGTPFYQISKVCSQKKYPFKYCCLGVSETANTLALFKRANDLNVVYRTDQEMGLLNLPDTRAQLHDFITDCDVLYLTIDLDVFPACDAPGVSAPASRGVRLDVIEPLIEDIKKSGKLRIADIAEYNPLFDIDQRTARLAARLFYNIAK